MEDIRKVGFCPHCGNKSPQKLIHTQGTSGTGWFISDGEEVDLTVVYFVASCETCNHILVYRAVEDIPDEKFFTSVDLEYPESGELHTSVPKTVSKIYIEALRIKSLAPNAFAVQIRRALEALCEDRGAKSGTLQKMLNELSTKGEIPSTLIEATDLLRLLGNIGAHASEDSVQPWQVRTIDEFFRAIVEYVYIAPNKIKEFRGGLKMFRSQTGT
ncbi:MAG: DUF4145 domain-containing protein [Chloroflexota bacterium]